MVARLGPERSTSQKRNQRKSCFCDDILFERASSLAPMVVRCISTGLGPSQTFPGPRDSRAANDLSSQSVPLPLPLPLPALVPSRLSMSTTVGCRIGFSVISRSSSLPVASLSSCNRVSICCSRAIPFAMCPVPVCSRYAASSSFGSSPRKCSSPPLAAM